MLIPVQFAVASNDGRSDMVDGASLVNLFAETLPPDAKTKVALYGTPGQSLFATVAISPIKAMEQLDGVLYVVTATGLYSITAAGVVTSIGSVVMAGDNVSIATNSIHIAFVDGAKGYYYSVSGGLHEFSGNGWYPANTVTSQDGYLIFNRAGTGQFFFTGILDTSLDPLDFATAEGAPDDTIGLLSDQSSLWLFGEKSIEIWYNDGVTPWSRMHGAYIETGIGAVHSAVQMANSIFFVGDNGIVFRTQGYSLVRVSTHAVEYQFLCGDISGAYAYSYIDEGHHFYVLTIPAINRTCVYDSSTDLWHERSHSVHGRHNGKCYARFTNKHLIGNYNSGSIYKLSMSTYTDNNNPIIREATSPVIHANNNRATMWGFNLDVEDSGLDTISGAAPKVSLQFSDDAGVSWSSPREKVFGTSTKKGRVVRWNSLGQFVHRKIKVKTSNSVPIVFGGAYAEVNRDN